MQPLLSDLCVLLSELCVKLFFNAENGEIYAEYAEHMVGFN